VKRYDCHIGEYFERSEGEFVRFVDAQAEIDRKLDPGIKTALCGEIRNLRDELTAEKIELAAAQLLMEEIDKVAAFPADGADVGRKVRLHNIRDKIAIYRKSRYLS
jgi:hypothetical protein